MGKKQRILGLGLLLLSGCASVSGSVGKQTWCEVYLPVETDPLTPENIQQQIDNNNVIWENWCGPFEEIEE